MKNDEPSAMSAMVVQLYRRKRFGSVSVEVGEYEAAVEFVQYMVEDLLCEQTVGMAVAVKQRGDPGFPTLHFQQSQGGCLLQVFAQSTKSREGRPGWHCLTDMAVTSDPVVDELVTVRYDGSTPKGFFPVRFSDGTFFSNDLLVPLERVLSALADYSEFDDVGEWVDTDGWVNLGLL